MIVENYPVYSPVKDGLAANYTINFGADLNHFLPLGGMFQGDAVKSKSLYVNNYNNAFSFSAIVGNDTLNIPAYRDGYIDVSHVDQVVFQSNQPGSVTVTVYNYANPVTDFSQRGVPPGQVNTTLPCNDNISQGDIVTLGADGFAYWANDPNLSISNLRPINNTTAAYNKMISNPLSQGSATTGYTRPFVMANGNIGIVYAISTGYAFMAINANGVVTPSTTIITIGTLVNILYATPLSGGGFALLYTGTYGSYNNPALAIFDNVGNQIYNQYITPTTSSSIAPYSICQIANGNIIVNVATSSSTYGLFEYTATGTLVGSLSLNTTCKTGVVYPYGNGFIFAGYGNSDYKQYVYIYSSSLVLQTTIVSSAILSNNSPANAACVKTLNGGSLAIVVYSVSASTGALATILHIDGSYINNIKFATTTIYAADICPTTDNGFIFATPGGGTYLNTFKINPDGSLYSTSPNTSVTSGTLSMSNAADLIFCAQLANGTNLVAYSPGKTQTYFIAQMNNIGALTPGTPAPAGMYVSDQPIIFDANNMVNQNPTIGAFIITGINGSSTLLGYLYAANQQTQTPMGVAVGPANPSQNVTVQISGTAQTRLTFKQNYTVNAQSQTPPGQKMAVIGNAATMQGIQ